MMRPVYKIPVFLLVFAVLGYLVRYALNVYLARHLSHGAYGDFVIAIRILSVVGAFVLVGSDVSAKRFLVKYLAKREDEKSIAYVRWNLKLVIIASAVIIIFIALIIAALFILHILGLSDFTDYHLAVYMLWISPVVALSLLGSSYLFCNQNYVLGALSSRLGRYVLMLGFFFAAVLLLGDKLNNVTLIVVVFAAFVGLSILQVISLVAKYPRNLLKKISQKFAVDKLHRKQWLQVSSRLAFVSAVFLLVTLTDLLIVEIVGSTEVMVDYYVAILVICKIIMVIALSTTQFIKPKINELLALDRKAELQAMLDRFNLLQLLFVLITTVLICVNGENLLRHFGNHYVTAIVPLIILAISYAFSAFSKTAVAILALSGNEKVLLYSAILELLFLVIFCSYATYFWGILGTAIATAIISSLRSIILIIITGRRLKLRAFLLF